MVHVIANSALVTNLEAFSLIRVVALLMIRMSQRWVPRPQSFVLVP